MKYILFFALLSLPFIQACTGDHHGKAEAIQLDKGNRWVANPETTSGIADMQAILVKYEGQTAKCRHQKSHAGRIRNYFSEYF
ncbi:MAG: hypothetical protein IPL27_11105 [Lewinellaceae bacterium]|nr:hypothetical protein [Lewinellaceae bacterium]